MWNGDDAEWYPGDEYVDIASTDIYADSGEYSSQINDFIAVSFFLLISGSSDDKIVGNHGLVRSIRTLQYPHKGVDCGDA